MAKIDLKKWSLLGFKIIMALPQILNTVESIKTALPALKGKLTGADAEDAAVDALKASLGLTEEVLEKDVLNDAKVEEALRAAIKAIVNVQNVVSAVKAAKA